MLSPLAGTDSLSRHGRGASANPGLKRVLGCIHLLSDHTPQAGHCWQMNLAIRNLIRLLRLLTGTHFDGNHMISLSVALLGIIIDRQRHQLVECSVLHGFRAVRAPSGVRS
jgi:hypothetical protein